MKKRSLSVQDMQSKVAKRHMSMSPRSSNQLGLQESEQTQQQNSTTPDQGVRTRPTKEMMRAMRKARRLRKKQAKWLRQYGDSVTIDPRHTLFTREILQKMKEKAETVWGVENIVWIYGVPYSWDTISTRQKLFQALKSQHNIESVTLRRDHPDLWTLCLSSKQEAQEMIGKTLLINTTHSGRHVKLLILGIQN